ncbi:MAG: hypothetical protein AB7F65_01755 [Dehalococcoidia bacterium]
MSSSVWRVYAPAVLGATALVWVVSFAWWLLLPDARVVPLHIPGGTAAAVARGEDVAVIPEQLELRQGDTLVVRNADDQVHRIGSEMVPPARTVYIAVTRALLSGQSLLCSIHPSGAIGISTLARPGILSTAIPTAIAGVPIAIALIVAMWIARRLDDEPRATLAS